MIHKKKLCGSRNDYLSNLFWAVKVGYKVGFSAAAYVLNESRMVFVTILSILAAYYLLNLIVAARKSQVPILATDIYVLVYKVGRLAVVVQILVLSVLQTPSGLAFLPILIVGGLFEASLLILILWCLYIFSKQKLKKAQIMPSKLIKEKPESDATFNLDQTMQPLSFNNTESHGGQHFSSPSYHFFGFFVLATSWVIMISMLLGLMVNISVNSDSGNNQRSVMVYMIWAFCGASASSSIACFLCRNKIM